MGEGVHDLQTLVTSISDCAAGLVLIINGRKTKNMLTGNHQHHTNVYIKQNNIENVEEYMYLGGSSIAKVIWTMN